MGVSGWSALGPPLAELLAAIGKAFPQINDTGSGKDRAALVRRFSALQDSFASGNGGMSESVAKLFSAPEQRKAIQRVVVEEPVSFSAVKMSSEDTQAPTAREMMEGLGFHFTINIAGDEATVNAPVGVRKPEVMTRRKNPETLR